ncbi:MAG: TerB family tellurite resistance protein [Candidatus Cloacimonetes bacterium]|nr:TerB family tellurite resistance protein [Candidatus Cloacimonadota bacterium]
MDRFQAAFKILYLISCVDGETCGEELDIIMAYLKKNQEDIVFDHRKVMQSLLFLSREGSLNELKNSAAVFKELSNQENRLCLLDFAFNLVVADGRISADEIRMFNILGEIWEIDIDEFLKNKQ